ncbi:hypothetical protein B0T20DRAFT_351943 [Sordaria brevicollis]|uniref:Uncharacterized protein n=1 Tax=Sordaria brevicollis TaxID=83679 RepID=A0AAE0PGB3_SORBR|nr:hypothetical protein B0T20DRAFT_351943 [Sordaria brevicollis]
MPYRFEELRTARKEGTPPRPPPKDSNEIPDRFEELRTARREGRPVHRPNTARKRDTTTEEGDHGLGQRRPTPYYNGHYRPSGADNVEVPRGRSRSSPPPRTRAVTPHPQVYEPRKSRKSKKVHWADDLELPASQTTDFEGNKRDSYVTKEEADEIPMRNFSRPLRRQRASSIPRAKRTTTDSEPEAWTPSASHRRATPTAIVKVSWNAGDTTNQTVERPMSPLVPPPLRLSPSKAPARRAIDTITSPAHAPEVQARHRQPRLFSFDDKPEVITVSPKSHYLHDQQDVQPPVQKNPSASKPLTISNLRDSLRRDGTVRRRLQKPNPALSAPEGSNKPTLRESTGSTKHRLSVSKPNPVPALPKISKQALRESTGSIKHRLSVSKIPNPASTLNPSFNAAKSFWNRIASSSSSGSSSANATDNGKEDGKPECIPPVPSKSIRVQELPGYKATDSANVTAKTPARPRRRLSKVHPMHAHACSVRCERVAHITPVPSGALYHVTETQKGGWISHRAVVGDTSSRFHSKSGFQDTASSISGSSNSSSSQPGKGPLSIANKNNALASTPRPKHKNIARIAPGLRANNGPMQANNTSTPSLQTQLFEDLMKLCTPGNSGSCIRGCVCDNCKWSGLTEVDRSSTVALVDGGERGRK